MMRKGGFIILILVCLPFLTEAQNRWPWNNGPLEWWMFRLRDTTEVSPTHFKLSWDTVPDAIRQRRSVILVNKIETYLNLDSSWVRANSVSEEILERNQRDFDRAHVLAEKNWRIALSGSLPIESYLDSCRVQFENGLGLMEAGDDLPQIEWSPEGKHIYSALSYVCLVPTGSLGRITGPTQGLSLESGLFSGNNMISAELSVGRGKYLNPYVTMTGGLADGAYVPYFGAFLKYSRTLLETSDVCISLFGGGGYSRREIKKDGNPVSLGGPSVSEGLAGEWRCFSRIQARKSPFRQSDYVVRVRLYLDHIWYQTPRVFSPTVNFSIGIGSKHGKVRPKLNTP